MVQQILAVFLVFALLAATLWLLRSRGLAQFRGPARRKSARHLESIARLPLAPQHSVHLVRVGDHVILLALSPTGCTLIERLEGNAVADVALAASSEGAGR